MSTSDTEQEFLTLFDTHVDALFSHCFSRIPDSEQTQELVEKAFKRAWDQITEGGQLGVTEFYGILDGLVSVRIQARGLSLPALFGHFSSTMSHSS